MPFTIAVEAVLREDERMNAVTLYGVVALTFMMLMYALERRHRNFILAFALGCVLSSVYGFYARIRWGTQRFADAATSPTTRVDSPALEKL